MIATILISDSAKTMSANLAGVTFVQILSTVLMEIPKQMFS
jgi:hypothetical protein